MKVKVLLKTAQSDKSFKSENPVQSNYIVTWKSTFRISALNDIVTDPKTNQNTPERMQYKLYWHAHVIVNVWTTTMMHDHEVAIDRNCHKSEC